MHERVQMLATIKLLLPVNPRPPKKPAGNQFYAYRTATRASTPSHAEAAAQRAQAKEDTELQSVDGSPDLVTEREQVDSIIDDYLTVVNDDEEDDDEYDVAEEPQNLGSSSCKLADVLSTCLNLIWSFCLRMRLTQRPADFVHVAQCLMF